MMNELELKIKGFIFNFMTALEILVSRVKLSLYIRDKFAQVEKKAVVFAKETQRQGTDIFIPEWKEHASVKINIVHWRQRRSQEFWQVHVKNSSVFSFKKGE